jgi:hypothetical protein
VFFKDNLRLVHADFTGFFISPPCKSCQKQQTLKVRSDKQ